MCMQAPQGGQLRRRVVGRLRWGKYPGFRKLVYGEVGRPPSAASASVVYYRYMPQNWSEQAHRTLQRHIALLPRLG